MIRIWCFLADLLGRGAALHARAAPLLLLDSFGTRLQMSPPPAPAVEARSNNWSTQGRIPRVCDPYGGG